MPRPARRLAVECLEDRAVLNSRFVVPVEVPADGFNNFYTLREALTTPGLVPGDVVQIEPLSNPGELRDGDLPFVRNLTIRGNPAVGSVETPAFVVPEAGEHFLLAGRVHPQGRAGGAAGRDVLTCTPPPPSPTLT